MSALDQPGPQLLEVVDLAVEDDRARPVLVRDRRVAGHEIDDRQAVLADRAVRRPERAVAIRPAVVHRCDLCFGNGVEVRVVAGDHAADAAHQLESPARSATIFSVSPSRVKARTAFTPSLTIAPPRRADSDSLSW